jgi:hypothetical protein
VWQPPRRQTQNPGAVGHQLAATYLDQQTIGMPERCSKVGPISPDATQKPGQGPATASSRTSRHNWIGEPQPRIANPRKNKESGRDIRGGHSSGWRGQLRHATYWDGHPLPTILPGYFRNEPRNNSEGPWQESYKGERHPPRSGFGVASFQRPSGHRLAVAGPWIPRGFWTVEQVKKPRKGCSSQMRDTMPLSG